MTAAMFSGFDMCSCVVTVAAAAQGTVTAEGAVEAAAGMAAEILGEAAGVVRNNIEELQSDNSD